MNKNLFIKAEEITKELGVSKPYAYKLISLNALTRRLNVNAERLLEEFNIYYESSRNRTGRQIKLTLTKK